MRGEPGADPRLADRVHAALDALRRTAPIYPSTHPVVGKALASLRDALGRYLEETGEPFVLRTDLLREASPDRDAAGKSAGLRAEARISQAEDLRRLLRRYLVRAVAILPNAEDRECLELAALLRDDPASRSGAGSAVDPDGWEGIHIELYTREDMGALIDPEDPSALDDSLMRASLSGRVTAGFGAWLASLPEDLAQAATDLLRRPAILSQITKLRFEIKRIEGAMAGGEGADLMTKILLKLAPRPQRLEEVSGALQNAVLALAEFAVFVEEHRATLADGGAAAPTARIDSLLEQFGAVLEARPEALREAQKLRCIREEVEALFTSAKREPPETDRKGDSGAAPDPRDGAIGAPGAAASPSEPLRAAVDGPRGGLKGVTYDLREFASAIARSDPRQTYLSAALELLSSDAHRRGVEASWGNVMRTATGGSADPVVVLARLQTVSRFLEERQDAAGIELAAGLLAAVDAPDDVARAIENALLPSLGAEGVKSLIELLARKRGDGALRVLLSLHRALNPALRAVAGTMLTSRAADPEALALWALDDPSCLARPGVMGCVGRAQPTSLLQAFRKAFAGASPERVRGVLDALPPDAAGMEQIVLAAVLSGPSECRRPAIGRLGRYPSGACIEFLSGIVRKNNAGTFCPQEVDAAIGALKAMRSPEALRFLRAVETERRWFRRVYRREIRDMVRGSGDGLEGA